MSAGDVASSWEDWAPPISPPDDVGVPRDIAEAIADEYWDSEPHLCSALQWEYWAAMQIPSPSVASVSTGIQSIAYSPASPSGEYGAALARAEWHRSFLSGTIESAPLTTLDNPMPSYPSVIEIGSWMEAR